jgi:hypothetical protein
MKTIILLGALVFSTGIQAQLNFSYQVNGLSVTFSVTQTSQYCEFTKWSFGDGTYDYGSPYTNFQTAHTYSVAGNYSVCFICYPMPMAPNDTTCKSINILGTGIHSNSREDLVHFFPNPVKDKLNVELSNSNTAFQLTLTNTLGETVYVSDKKNGEQPAIDLSALASGIYFIKVENKREQKIFRIVKE